MKWLNKQLNVRDSLRKRDKFWVNGNNKNGF